MRRPNSTCLISLPHHHDRNRFLPAEGSAAGRRVLGSSGVDLEREGAQLIGNVGAHNLDRAAKRDILVVVADNGLGGHARRQHQVEHAPGRALAARPGAKRRPTFQGLSAGAH